jgi:hypothetical protein
MNTAPGLERFERALVPALHRDLVRRTRQRRGATALTVAAAVAAASLVGIPRLGHNGSDGSPLARAEAALAVAGSGVLHVRIDARQVAPDGATVSWQDESWRALRSGQLRTTERAAGKPVVEVEKGSDGTARMYDAATNTIYELSAAAIAATPKAADPGAGDAGIAIVGSVIATEKDGTRVVVGENGGKLLVSPGAALPTFADAGTVVEPPPAWVAPYALRAAKHADVAGNVASGSATAGAAKPVVVTPLPAVLDPQADSFLADVQQLLRSGAAHTDGTVVVDGRRALRIAGADATSVYLVDPTTYEPIGWDTEGTGGSLHIRVTAYERMPAGPAANAALSLTAQHPSARIDQDPADFAAAKARLFAGG